MHNLKLTALILILLSAFGCKESKSPDENHSTKRASVETSTEEIDPPINNDQILQLRDLLSIKTVALSKEIELLSPFRTVEMGVLSPLNYLYSKLNQIEKQIDLKLKNANDYEAFNNSTFEFESTESFAESGLIGSEFVFNMPDWHSRLEKSRQVIGKLAQKNSYPELKNIEEFLLSEEFIFLKEESSYAIQEAYKLRILTNKLERLESRRFERHTGRLATKEIISETARKLVKYTETFLNRVNNRKSKVCREDRAVTLDVLRKVVIGVFNVLQKQDDSDLHFLEESKNVALKNLSMAEGLMGNRTTSSKRKRTPSYKIKSCQSELCSIPEYLKRYYEELNTDEKGLTDYSELSYSVELFNEKVEQYKRANERISSFVKLAKDGLKETERLVQSVPVLIEQSTRDAITKTPTRYRKDIIICEAIKALESYEGSRRRIANEVDGIRTLNIVRYFGHHELNNAYDDLINLCNEDSVHVHKALLDLNIPKGTLSLPLHKHSHIR